MDEVALMERVDEKFTCSSLIARYFATPKRKFIIADTPGVLPA